MQHLATVNAALFIAGQLICLLCVAFTMWNRLLTGSELVLAGGAVLLMLSVLL